MARPHARSYTPRAKEESIVTMKRFQGFLAVAGLAVAASVTSGLACDDHKKATDAKAAKAVR